MNGVGESRLPRQKNPHRIWLIVPTLVVAVAMLPIRHGWLAMFAFHGVMLSALIVHRRRLDWRMLYRRPSGLSLTIHLAAAAVTIPLFSVAVFAYAHSHGGYGELLDAQLSRYHIPAASRPWFAVQLCALNPLLEELFWRGLFFSNRKRPAATDFCYAAFHYFALLPFMPAMQAAIGTLALVGFGYALRQLARQQNGSLVLPLLWHALGDAAIMAAIARLTH